MYQLTKGSALPPRVEAPDDPYALLLAAKALVFCGFPLQPTSRTSIAREAQLGAETHLTVFFSTTEPGVPIPFGADRALLAWITTLTYDSGFVTFSNLTDFFDAFQLARSGVQYQRFEQRLRRLLSLSLSVILKTPSGIVRLNMRPLQKAYTPRDGYEARRLLAAEKSSPPALALTLGPQAVRHRPRSGVPRVSSKQPSCLAAAADAEISLSSPLLGCGLLLALPLLVSPDEVADRLAAGSTAARQYRPARSTARVLVEPSGRRDSQRLPGISCLCGGGLARPNRCTFPSSCGALPTMSWRFHGKPEMRSA
jgi:hypothetical protein